MIPAPTPQPSPRVVAILLRALVDSRGVMWLRVDAGAALLDFGGDWARFSPAPPVVGHDVLDQFPVLTGVVPADDAEPQTFSAVAAGRDRYADVYREPDGESGWWLLVRDVSEEFLHRRMLQQNARDLALANEEVRKRAEQLAAANTALDAARARADALLHAILPAQAVETLKGGAQRAADLVDSATVVIVAVHRPEDHCARLGPMALVEFLASVFSRLDRLAAEFELERVKSVAESYIAASGVPVACEGHAERAADFALGALSAAAALRAPDDAPVRLRIALASGPLVAGVIGAGRLAFDLWGHTPSLATHLAQSCIPGSIHADEPTARLLETRFSLRPRGSFFARDFGEIRTFLLHARRA